MAGKTTRKSGPALARPLLGRAWSGRACGWRLSATAGDMVVPATMSPAVAGADQSSGRSNFQIWQRGVLPRDQILKFGASAGAGLGAQPLDQIFKFGGWTTYRGSKFLKKFFKNLPCARACACKCELTGVDDDGVLRFHRHPPP